jgi:hypothetical protein
MLGSEQSKSGPIKRSDYLADHKKNIDKTFDLMRQMTTVLYGF